MLIQHGCEARIWMTALLDLAKIVCLSILCHVCLRFSNMNAIEKLLFYICNHELLEVYSLYPLRHLSLLMQAKNEKYASST